MKMYSKLKPCPFCGGKANLHQAANWNAGVYETWVRCDECCATVSGRDVPLTHLASEEGILSTTAAWNRRIEIKEEKDNVQN